MKNIVITGGSDGIGNALCYGFADLGYNVISFDVNDYNFDKKNIHTYNVNLLSESEIKSCFNEVVDKFGPIHILINNRAISKFNKSICVSLSGSNITVNCVSPGWIETGDYASLSELDHSISKIAKEKLSNPSIFEYVKLNF